MTSDRFWHMVEVCRTHSVDMPTFNAVLRDCLTDSPPEELWSFHNWVWHYVQHLQFKGGFNAELNACLEQHMGLALGGDRGDCYVGWAIAQGRSWYDTLDNVPRRSAERLPTWEDIWQGEHVLFVAFNVFHHWTGQVLQEIFEDDKSV